MEVLRRGKSNEILVLPRVFMQSKQNIDFLEKSTDVLHTMLVTFLRCLLPWLKFPKSGSGEVSVLHE